jgi:hypothetical protein
VELRLVFMKKVEGKVAKPNIPQFLSGSTVEVMQRQGGGHFFVSFASTKQVQIRAVVSLHNTRSLFTTGTDPVTPNSL